jgi:hypothetical protein
MKKLYYGLIIIGALAGMQSQSYGAAEPVDPNKVYKKVTSIFTRYSKGDKNTAQGELICKKMHNNDNVFSSNDGYACWKEYTDPTTNKLARKNMIELSQKTYLALEAEYNQQRNKEDQLDKKAAGEQVPGGYMVPNPQGGWIPKPDSKDNKEGK